MTVLTRTDSPTMNEDERLTRDEAAVSRDFWRKFAGLAAQIPFAEDLLTAYYCAFDRQTPSHVRVALIGALLYFISPLDLHPGHAADRRPERRRRRTGRRDQARLGPDQARASRRRARGAGADEQDVRDLERVNV